MATHFDNPLWVFCCCGCLPWIGLLKAIINIPFSLVLNVLGHVILCIAAYPHDVYYTYFTFFSTPRLGPNIKILGFVLLPIAFLLYPLFVFCFSAIFGVGIAIAMPMSKTFEDGADCVLWSGIPEIYTGSFDQLKSFWKFLMNSYFVYLCDYRAPLKSGEEVFDISVLQLLVGAGLAVVGVVVDGALVLVLCTIKLLPGILTVYYELWGSYRKKLREGGRLGLAMFPFFVLGNVLALPLCALIYLLCVICAMFYGMTAAAVGYQSGVAKALQHILLFVSQFDEGSGDSLCPPFKGCRVSPPCHCDTVLTV